MGTVLVFRRGPRPLRPHLKPGAPRPSGWGEVVIFPGVRIERAATAAGSLDLATRIGRKQEWSALQGFEPEPGRRR